MGSHQKGILIGLASGLLWGINNLFFAYGYSQFSSGAADFDIPHWHFILLLPLTAAAANDTFAALSLLLYNGMRGLFQQIFSSFKTIGGRTICAAALLGGPIGQSTYYMGIVMAGPMYALMLTALYPIVGCLLSRLFLKQQINFRMWLGIILSVIGAMLTNYVPFHHPPEGFFLGILCSGIAAIAWGSEIVLAVRGMEEIDPDIAISIRETVSGIVLLAICCMLGKDGSLTWPVISKISETSLLSFAAAGIAAGASYAFWYSANRWIGCAKGTATNSTFIVWGVLLNFFFGESPDISGMTLTGCALLLAGVALVIINPIAFLSDKQSENQ